jgi:dihydrofolate reductase
MSKIKFEISVSLDGYVTASGVSLEDPMGPGGQLLHEWAFGDDDRSYRVLADSQGSSGASIAGRRTYDVSISSWGADGPGMELRTPTFIVSHSVPESVPGGVYTFVSSPEEALAQARAVAGDKDVDVFSADIGSQLLAAGHIDEVYLHVVPVLLGSGTRLFDQPDREPILLRLIDVTQGSKANHQRYEVVSNRAMSVEANPLTIGGHPQQ